MWNVRIAGVYTDTGDNVEKVKYDIVQVEAKHGFFLSQEERS